MFRLDARVAVLVICILSCLSLRAGQVPAHGGAPEATAEAAVRELYALINVHPGGPGPDWEKVRSLFLKDAVLVLRTAPDATSVFSVQGYIDDFVAFNKRARVAERGYAERIVRLQPWVFGDIAHVLVLYEASIPGASRPSQQGIDSFQLVRRDGRWWIACVVNELPTADRPVPASLQDRARMPIAK